MSLKTAILDAVTTERLAAIAEELDVAQPARVPDPRVALKKARVDALDLLPHLSATEVRLAAQAFRVPDFGERDRLIQALLEAEAYRDSGSEIALRDDGPFLAISVDVANGPDGEVAALQMRAVRAEGRTLSLALQGYLRPLRTGPWRIARRVVDATELPRAEVAAALVDDFAAVARTVRYLAFFRAERCAAALASSGLVLPPLPIQCVGRLVRGVFGIKRVTLANAADAAGVDEKSDIAAATARIVWAAQRKARARSGH